MLTRAKNRHHWIGENLSSRHDLIEKKMFGCLAYYLSGKLVLVLGDKDDPWNGVLVPTDFIHQESLIHDLPNLIKHPILGKWLYLAESTPEFEDDAVMIAKLILKNDSRIGVVPKPKKKKKI